MSDLINSKFMPYNNRFDGKCIFIQLGFHCEHLVSASSCGAAAAVCR